MNDLPTITHLRDLTPDHKNARRHTPRNVGMIETALGEVGAARSIVIDENGKILAGNGVVEAAAIAGIEKVQVVDADGETLIAVRRTGLTEDQKTRLALYDNRSAELAEWDVPVLADLSTELDLSSLWHEDEFKRLVDDTAARQLTQDHRAHDMMRTMKAVDGYDDCIDIEKLGYRLEAVAHCSMRRRALELFAGKGVLSYWYGRLFSELLRVDISPEAQPDIVAPAEAWLRSGLDVSLPFDFIDFDDSGCPSQALQAFFRAIAPVHWPGFILCLTDGLGLALRVRTRQNLHKQYRWGDPGVYKTSRALFEAFPALVEHHLKTIAAEAGYVAERISLYRGTHMNVVYACYEVMPNVVPDSSGAG